MLLRFFRFIAEEPPNLIQEAVLLLLLLGLLHPDLFDFLEVG